MAGITAENYYAQAKTCLAARGTGFLIALADGETQGVKYRYSAKQWGAWVMFFSRIGLKHGFMAKRDWYQVPTEWPHEFTLDATVQGDHAIGAEFERRFLARRAADEEAYARTDERKLRIAGMARRLRDFSKKGEPTPAEHLAAPEIIPPWRDPEKLRESAERIAREASNVGD